MSCHQYKIRLRNLDEDLHDAGFTKEEASTFRVSDFVFEYIPADNKDQCTDVKTFIEKHEWLGRMPTQPTHRFIAWHKPSTQLAGAIVLATPNSFSHLLGEEYLNQEKLISRGACISWSPKNLGSALIMFSIRWMTKNTGFRVFTAYSDPQAEELGTIYQACNFIYLGRYGASSTYFHPKNPKKGMFSDREFRKLGAYKRYARQLGIKWSDSWNVKGSILWNRVPPNGRALLFNASRDHESSCLKVIQPAKHKYAHIRGLTKKETQMLRQRFADLHPDKINLPYPRIRGQ